MDQDEVDGDVHLLWVGLVLEGILVAVALGLAILGLYDHRQPLNQINAIQCWDGLRWGVLATIPLIGFLIVFHFSPTRFLKPMRDFCLERLYPVFRGSTWPELVVLSLMAGFGEELLFRWCLQGGITSLLTERCGTLIAMTVGLVVASILFGLCHWVNASYGITTLLVGCYFGLILIWTGNFLVPAIAHALYDLIALLYLARIGSPVSND